MPACSRSYGLDWLKGPTTLPGITSTAYAREYVGTVPGTDVVLGLAVAGTTVTATVVGGPTSYSHETAKFSGSLSGHGFLLISSDGKRSLTGTLNGDAELASAVDGKLTLSDGTSTAFSAGFANVAAGAGIFHTSQDGLAVDVVVTNDGHGQGVANGGAAPVAIKPGTSPRCLVASVTLPGESSAHGVPVGAGQGACTLPPPPAKKAGVTLFVDGAKGADDTNDGTEARPYKTIQHAVDAAGDGSHVVVKPGVYRESVTIADRTNFEIDAKSPNSVTVAGSDVFTGWTPDPTRPGVYLHPWALKLGDAPTSGVTVAPLARRQEMVFVAGHQLNQVLDPTALGPGTFAVDEGAGLIEMRPERYDPANDQVEVSVRPLTSSVHGDAAVLLATNCSGLHLTGLSFTHGNRALADGAAVMVTRCQDVALVNCSFSHNNGVGLGLTNVSGLVLTNVQCDGNGTQGLVADGATDGSASLVEANGNNWRGAEGGVFDGIAAGMTWRRAKNLALEKLQVRDNQAPGAVFDPACSNVTVQSLLAAGNRAGLVIRSTGGPFNVQDCELANNELGLLASDAGHVMVQNAAIAHNSRGQVVVSSTLADGKAPGDRRAVTDWTLRGNIIAADADCKAPLIDGNADLGLEAVPPIPGFDAFFVALTVEANLYYHAGSPTCFRVADGSLVDLAGWRKLTKQDVKANFTAEAINQANLRLDAEGVVHP